MHPRIIPKVVSHLKRSSGVVSSSKELETPSTRSGSTYDRVSGSIAETGVSFDGMFASAFVHTNDNGGHLCQVSLDKGLAIPVLV